MNGHTSLREFQYVISRWQSKTFPDATIEGVIAHLRKEVEEFAQAHECADTTGARMELADMAMLVICLADMSGEDLPDAINEKYEINLKRKWGKRNEEGFYEHVRDNESQSSIIDIQS